MCFWLVISDLPSSGWLAVRYVFNYFMFPAWWEQFRYVRMNLFVQTGAQFLDYQSFNDAALVKILGRTTAFNQLKESDGFTWKLREGSELEGFECSSIRVFSLSRKAPINFDTAFIYDDKSTYRVYKK